MFRHFFQDFGSKCTCSRGGACENNQSLHTWSFLFEQREKNHSPIKTVGLISLTTSSNVFITLCSFAYQILWPSKLPSGRFFTSNPSISIIQMLSRACCSVQPSASIALTQRSAIPIAACRQMEQTLLRYGLRTSVSTFSVHGFIMLRVGSYRGSYIPPRRLGRQTYYPTSSSWLSSSRLKSRPPQPRPYLECHR